MQKQTLPVLWHRNSDNLIIVPAGGGSMLFGNATAEYLDEEYLAANYPGAQEMADLQELEDISLVRYETHETMCTTVYTFECVGRGRNAVYSALIMLSYKSVPTNQLDGYSRLSTLIEDVGKHYPGSTHLDTQQFADLVSLRTPHSPETLEYLSKYGCTVVMSTARLVVHFMIVT